MMRKLHDYNVYIPKELYEPGDRPVFRRRNHNWQDMEACFDKLVAQAFYAFEHGGYFLCEAYALVHTRIHMLKLKRTCEDGRGVEMHVTYLHEMKDIYVMFYIDGVATRARTAWLSNGILILQPDSYANWLHFEPCWVGDHFIDEISILLLKEFRKIELRSRF